MVVNMNKRGNGQGGMDFMVLEHLETQGSFSWCYTAPNGKVWLIFHPTLIFKTCFLCDQVTYSLNVQTWTLQGICALESLVDKVQDVCKIRA